MSLDSSATQYASSMDVNLVRNVFVPSYTFDGSLGQFSVQLDTNLRGNVNVGDTTTNYSLKINGSIVQTVSTGYHWSTLPAIQTVDMNGYGLINISIGNAAGPQTLYYNPATESITYNPTFTLPPGSNWGEYLYWNGTTYSLGSSKIVLGANAGQSNQGINAVAIGGFAGYSNQGPFAIAIGNFAALADQSSSAVAIGNEAGGAQQGANAVAIGPGAGANTQGASGIAIGDSAAYSGQGDHAIAIGTNVADGGSGSNAIGIGKYATRGYQSENSIVLNATGTAIVADPSRFYVAPIRSNVGPASVYYDSTSKEITYGPTVSAGLTIPTGSLYGDYLRWNPATSAYVVASRSIAVGGSAGVNQGDLAVAIGFEAGCNAQVNNAVSIGTRAGRTGQGQDGIAIGRNAADSGQGESSIAIGTFAAQGTSQHPNSIVISALGGTPLITSNANALYVAPVRSNVGPSAVYYNSTSKEMTYGPGIPSGAYFGDYLYWNSNSNAYLVGSTNLTLGRNAGAVRQGVNSIAVGENAGGTDQNANSIAIGNSAGNISQGGTSIAIGYQAGNSSQGRNAIAIGYTAGQTSQHSNSIVISAIDGTINTQSNSALYVAPIRTDTATTGIYGLGYNDSTKEIVKTAVNAVQTITVGTGLSNSGTAQNPIINLTSQPSTGALFFLTVGCNVPYSSTPIVANTQYSFNVSGYTKVRVILAIGGGAGGGGGGGAAIIANVAGNGGGGGGSGFTQSTNILSYNSSNGFFIKIGGGGVGGPGGERANNSGTPGGNGSNGYETFLYSTDYSTVLCPTIGGRFGYGGVPAPASFNTPGGDGTAPGTVGGANSGITPGDGGVGGVVLPVVVDNTGLYGTGGNGGRGCATNAATAGVGLSGKPGLLVFALYA